MTDEERKDMEERANCPICNQIHSDQVERDLEKVRDATKNVVQMANDIIEELKLMREDMEKASKNLDSVDRMIDGQIEQKLFDKYAASVLDGGYKGDENG
jgi:hypothetical protein